LQHLRHTSVWLLWSLQAAKVNTPAQALLYFGCRKAEEDYLYQQGWQDFMEAGALSKLRVAFSRAQANKVCARALVGLLLSYIA
jgi:hypothetical protein